MTATHLRTIDDVKALVLRNLEPIPEDVGLVVGVPYCGMLVASRVEKYGSETAEWLARPGVESGEILMLRVQSREDRIEREVQHEVRAYRRTSAPLLVESCARQATPISEKDTGRPVYCTATRRSGGDPGPIARRGTRSLPSQLRGHARRLLRGRRAP